MFFILGISVSVFLEFLLLIKKNKSRADKILVIWLLLIFFHQLLNYLLHTEDLFKYPHLLGIEFPMPVLHGVLLYFYVTEITGKRFKNVWVVLIHLIPAVSLIVLAIPFYLLSGAEKIYIFEHDGIGYEWYILYSVILVFVSGLFYTGWSLILIQKHQNDIQQKLSNTDKKELQWLRYLSISLGVIWVLTIFFDYSIIFSAVVVLVLFIGFFGINQLGIFNTSYHDESDFKNFNESQPTKSVDDSTTQRYAKSGLNEEMADQIYSNLNKLMPDESLYKNYDLTLADLAKRLAVHPNHLSQVINEKEQKNFYYYINSLRIKEFIKLASDKENKKYTLLSLAYDCGFNSKSTFNKHFKEYTGKTPTDYFKAQAADA